MELDLFGIIYSKTEEFNQKEVDFKTPHIRLHLSRVWCHKGGVTPAVPSCSLPQEKKSQQHISNFKLHTRDVIRTYFSN